MSIIQLLLSVDWEEEVIVIQPGDEEYTTPGEFTFTVPGGITEISAVVIGGGGGGGSNYGNGQYSSAGGGGGGLSYGLFDVTPGENLRVIIGEAGNGGTYNGYSITPDAPGSGQASYIIRPSFNTKTVRFPGDTWMEVKDSTGTSDPGCWSWSDKDYTIEAWVLMDNYAHGYGSAAMISHGSQTWADHWSFGVDINGNLSFYSYGTTNGTNSGVILTSAATVSLFEWHHIALVHNLSTNLLTLYIDGVADVNTSSTVGRVGSNSNTDPLMIGRVSYFSSYYTGYMSSLHIAHEAIYTSNFTPPSISSIVPRPTTKVLAFKSQTDPYYCDVLPIGLTAANVTEYNFIGSGKTLSISDNCPGDVILLAGGGGTGGLFRNTTANQYERRGQPGRYGGIESEGGGNGGYGGLQASNYGGGGGGGGAGGYDGNGGNGGIGQYGAGSDGAGGGGGGGSCYLGPYSGGSGGGTGFYGRGANGAGAPYQSSNLQDRGGGGGSGGTAGSGIPYATTQWHGPGGLYGGGGGSTDDYGTNTPGAAGGHGGARIIWGENRFYPTTQTLGIAEYSITAPSTANEGDVIDFQVTTTNVLAGVEFTYTIEGPGIEPEDLRGITSPEVESIYLGNMTDYWTLQPDDPYVLANTLGQHNPSNWFYGGPFTYEWWFAKDTTTFQSSRYWMGSNNRDLEVYEQGNNGGFYAASDIGYNSSGGPSTIFGTSVIPEDTWIHMAVQRFGSNGDFGIYVNGARKMFNYFRRKFTVDQLTDWFIGNASFHYNGYAATGYYTNIRLSTGTRYGTSSFTPPTEPFVNDANTVFLVQGTNVISDHANWTLTKGNNYSAVTDTESTNVSSPFLSGTAYGRYDGNKIYSTFTTTENSATTTVPVRLDFDPNNLPETDTLIFNLKSGDRNSPTIATASVDIQDVFQTVTITSLGDILEGEAATFSLYFENFNDGTTIYYAAEGTAFQISDADFDPRTGSFQIYPGGQTQHTTTFSIQTTFNLDNNDTLASPVSETFNLTLYRDAALTLPLATSESVTITGRAPQIDSITVKRQGGSVGDPIYEGDTLEIYVTWSNMYPAYTMYFYPSPANSTDTASSTSIVTPGSSVPRGTGAATAYLNLLYDTIVDNPQYRIRVFLNGIGDLGYSDYFTINDVVPSYSLAVENNQTTVAENQTINFVLTTTGLSAGTTLYYDIQGTVDANDIGSLTGSFTTSGNTTLIPISFIAEDPSGESDETFYINVRTGSETGTIVATSPSVTLTDAEPPTGENITSSFYEISNRFINSQLYMGSTADYTGNYDVGEVQTDFGGTGRVYIGVKVTSSTTFYNDVPIAGIQIVDSSKTTLLESWIFNTSTGGTGSGWETYTQQIPGSSTIGFPVTPATAAGYTYSYINTSIGTGKFAFLSNTGSSYTGAADGISSSYYTAAAASAAGVPGGTIAPVGDATVPQAFGTYYAYRETSGSTLYSGTVMRSPQFNFSGGEWIRVIHALTGANSPQMNPDDSIYVAVI